MTMVLNITRLNVDRVPINDGMEYLGDWFRDEGYERAKACTSATEANDILANTYKGPDAAGDQLDWNPKFYADNA